jgi:hypothetical protein
MAITQGYDGSCNAPTSEVASNAKLTGHEKEEIFAKRIGGYVVRGIQKPDVIKDNASYSVKGALKNIQFCLLSFSKSAYFYGVDSPMHTYQRAGYDHKYFKMNNGNKIDTDLFDEFYNAGLNVAVWLRNPEKFRIVLEKVISDNYDVNKLAVLKEFDDDALVYDMKDVIDLYVNSEYEIYVTEGGKISVRVGGKEVFYLEVRGSTGKVGSLNHGVRAPKFYSFLQENLKCESIPA